MRNPFNSQSLIYHLTNSNGCGNLWSKVLLTVSPFRPSLLPQPCVYFRNRPLLPSHAPRGANISPVLSTLRILPVVTGVSPLRHSPSMPSPPLRSLCPCLPRPGRGGKSHLFSSLPPLEISWRSFCNPHRLFSIACTLFSQNAGVGGHPECFYGIPGVGCR
jgi:hypothetical protein